jgi:hypothetical protein
MAHSGSRILLLAGTSEPDDFFFPGIRLIKRKDTP